MLTSKAELFGEDSVVKRGSSLPFDLTSFPGVEKFGRRAVNQTDSPRVPHQKPSASLRRVFLTRDLWATTRSRAIARVEK